MARQPRYVLPGQPQHVIQRGNNGSPVFFGEGDYRFYLHALRDACAVQHCEVHAYVLMPNHVHLLATPRRENSISKVMQSVGGRYTHYVNATYGRKGTLWEGRYRSTVVDPDEYLLACMRYIELNPVRAGLVDSPQAYPWSSHAFNIGAQADSLIAPHESYRMLGDTVRAQHDAYRASFGDEIAHDVLHRIREATNKGWVLGGAPYIARIEALANRRVQPLPRGGDRRDARLREKKFVNSV